MKVKKIKIASIFVSDTEKEITSKKDGKVYKLCDVSIKVADDCPDYAGKWIRSSFFGDEKKSATSKAEYFKSQNDGKEIIVNVEEQTYTNKEGEEAVSLKFKLLSKKEKELAEQFIK